MCSNSLQTLGIGCVCLAGLMAATARAELVKQSPFESRQAAVVPTPVESRVEFLGYVETREGRLFRVRAPAQGTEIRMRRIIVVPVTHEKLNEPVQMAAAFVPLGVFDPEVGLTVRHFDEETGMLTVEHQGRVVILPVRKSKMVSKAVVVSPTSSDYPGRLEIAEEINRRRMLRAQVPQSAP